MSITGRLVRSHLKVRFCFQPASCRHSERAAHSEHTERAVPVSGNRTPRPRPRPPVRKLCHDRVWEVGCGWCVGAWCWWVLKNHRRVTLGYMIYIRPLVYTLRDFAPQSFPPSTPDRPGILLLPTLSSAGSVVGAHAAGLDRQSDAIWRLQSVTAASRAPPIIRSIHP